jgi:hypothetical protein
MPKRHRKGQNELKTENWTKNKQINKITNLKRESGKKHLK